MTKYQQTFKMELINKQALREEIFKIVAEERAEIDIDINSIWVAINEIKERLDCLSGQKMFTKEELDIDNFLVGAIEEEDTLDEMRI